MPTPTRSGRRPVQVPDRAAGARRVTLAALLAAALGAVVALAGLAAPASAHGGDVVISLGTDGAGGISVNLTYKNDGHPVEESADVTVTAESDAGETVGPVALRSASEGVGWYVSDPGVLAEGHWLLTATMTEPAEATASAQVDVVAPPEAAPSDGDADASAADSSAEAPAGTSADEAADPDAPSADAAGAGSDGDGPSALVWVALAAALLAAGASSAVVARRRARTRTSTTPASR